MHIARPFWGLPLAVLIGCNSGTSTDTPRAVIGPLLELPAAGPTDDVYRARVTCPECLVSRSSPTTLRLTGRSYTKAKVFEVKDGGRAWGLALDDQGNIVDEPTLLANEAKAVEARQGKLRDELYLLSSSGSDELVKVWIWPDFQDELLPKDLLIANPTLRASNQSARLAKLRSATAKITNWLDARGYKVHLRGDKSPQIVAELPQRALMSLGRLDGVAIVGQQDPITLSGTTWFSAVKGSAAQGVIPSTSLKFCNNEGTQPDRYTFLNVPASNLRDQFATPAPHNTWTSELVSGTSGSRMAPGAPTFIASWRPSTDPTGSFDAIEWCLNNTAHFVNRSWTDRTVLSPGGLDAVDMSADFYVRSLPWPLIVAGAANCGTNGILADCSGFPNAPAVGNRGFNYLVVGASDDGNTTSTSDDTIGNFSAWTNPTTTHGDYELPHLVAPGVNVSSASATGTGTSAAAPITLGSAMLAVTRDFSRLNSWPETVRAMTIATATHPVNGARTISLPAGDLKQGAGLLNADKLVYLADPAFAAVPNGTSVPYGRIGKSYTFATDFPNGVASDQFFIYGTGARIRVALAWDSTISGCSANGAGCMGDVLDADLDLSVLKLVNGQFTTICTSNSSDSSWEVCDFAGALGDEFKVQIRLFAHPFNITFTDVGLAWSTYLTSQE